MTLGESADQAAGERIQLRIGDGKFDPSKITHEQITAIVMRYLALIGE